MTEARRLADTRRADGVRSGGRRRPRVGRADVDVAGLVDREPRVVTGALVERLATERRRDDAGHRHQSAGDRSTVYGCVKSLSDWGRV